LGAFNSILWGFDGVGKKYQMNEPFLFVFGLIVTALAIGPYVFLVIYEQKSKNKK
jgi:hypothetical protein